MSGTVNAWRFNRHGHLDGLYLSDGTEVRFPPHLGGSVDAILDLGSPVQVSGERHVKPDGRVHISARTLTNSATGQSVTVR